MLRRAIKKAGRENNITIKASSGLDEKEIESMIADAATHAEEDKKTVELSQARNQCDALIHATRQSLEEHGQDISDDEKKNIESAMSEAEDAMKDGDIDDIRAKSEALAKAASSLANKKTEADKTVNGAGGDGGDGGDDNIVDADFQEVDEDKK